MMGDKVIIVAMRISMSRGADVSAARGARQREKSEALTRLSRCGAFSDDRILLSFKSERRMHENSKPT
jgi:hypothetical protein